MQIAMNSQTMMLFFCLSLLVIQQAQSTSKKPEVRILVLTQLTGISASASTLIDTVRLAKFWQQHLNERLLNDPTWPFNATLEFYDTKSDVKYTAKLLAKRYADTTLPPITIITGPETKSLLKPVAQFSSSRNIPFVSFNSGQISFPRLAIYNNSFFVNPQNVFQYIQLVESYKTLGVKTIVAVAMPTLGTVGIAYNPETCFGAANLATTKGMKVLSQITLNFNMTYEDIFQVVKTVKDLNPDGIMWCDQYSNIAPYVVRYNPMPHFKALNYLPKILTLIDALDAPDAHEYKEQGLLMFVSSGAFICDKILGADYTEQNTSYSSVFRYKKTVTTINDQINFGSTTEVPSSTQLFYRWYRQYAGGTPQRRTITLWGTFDVIEAAIYRATQVSSYYSDKFISAQEVLDTLRHMRLPTPGGPVDFGADGDNIAFNTLVVQAQSLTDSAEIVYPGYSKTAEIIYPMPTWDERVYEWKLVKNSYVVISIAIASLCSALLIAIIITVIIFRKNQDIRMMHYMHILVMCICALTVMWSLVFLWQSDNTHTQCKAYLWTTFLPASFLVHLANMKAYRLSLFVIATSSGRRPKPFSHMKVFTRSIYLTCFTVVLLLIVAVAFPPERTKFVKDKWRPKFDEYRCSLSTEATGLLGFLVGVHILSSIVSVAAVRNGMEEFRDGLTIKEAFFLLYICLAVAFIMGMLNLDSGISYLLRTAILTVGVTSFLFRLLSGRVVYHWIPETIQYHFENVHMRYLKPIMSTINQASNIEASTIIAKSIRDDSDDIESPVYMKEIPKDTNVRDMIDVLRNPARRKLFREVANKALCHENLSFLLKVLDFEDECEKELIRHSSLASDVIKSKATEIYFEFVKDGCPEEVNLSSATKKLVEEKLSHWRAFSPLISGADAKHMLEIDLEKRVQVFEPAFKAISIMTYQNLWNKFREAEATQMATDEESSSMFRSNGMESPHFLRLTLKPNQISLSPSINRVVNTQSSDIPLK